MKKRALLAWLLIVSTLIAAQTADDLMQAGMAFGRQRNFVDATRLYTKVLAMEIPPETRLQALKWRGINRRLSGDWVGANLDFDEAIKLQPEDPQYYRYRAECLHASGRDDEAEKDYLKILELDPKADDAWIGLGEIKSARRDYKTAIASYTQAIELKPDNSLAYNRRATARANAGDEPGAIADMDTVIGLFPKDAGLHYYRGVIKNHRGSTTGSKAALVDFDRAIELNPNQPRYYKDRANCRSLLGDSEGAAADVAKYNDLVRSQKK